jgi:hypothetical protein
MWNCETELYVLENQISIKFYKWRDNDLSLIEQKVDTRNTTLTKYSSGDPPLSSDPYDYRNLGKLKSKMSAGLFL